MNTSNIIPRNELTLSFIVPAMNEEHTIEELYDGIRENVKDRCASWEVIFIDDGSTDLTWQKISSVAKKSALHVRAFRFSVNRGKADALALGYSEAIGDIVFTMDADLQDDPKEIGRFLDKLEEGYDIVTGWKRKRHDPWHKVLPSRVFNATLSKLTGVSLHDHNCGFKAYRRKVVKALPMYGDMHRMVPSLASFKGFKTAEIVVEHHAREHGESKYGWSRILIGVMDMMTVSFLQRFRYCPMHFAGKLAGMLLFLGFACLVTGVVLNVFGTSAIALYVATGFTVLTALVVATQGLMLEQQVYTKMGEGRKFTVAESYNAEDGLKAYHEIHQSGVRHEENAA